MAINSSNYKWYQSAQWDDTATNGGALSATATITSNLIGNTFATVARAYAITGTRNYRKVYWKNEDLVTFPSAKCYISATCSSTYANIFITPATSTADTQAQATTYTWYQPFASTSTNALVFGDMATTTSTGIWLKMVIDANCPGFDANTFTITVIDTY